MLVSKKLIEKILDEPALFGEILVKMNTGGGVCKPDTLIRRLQRYSTVISNNNIIVDYFRGKGLSDAEIFENELVVS